MNPTDTIDHSTDNSTTLKNNKLKNLRDIINTLEEYQLVEIIKIIKKNNIKYTQNKNGIFLNMCRMDDTIIDSIEKYLIFIEKY
jgi:hypothetical protein